MRTIKSMKALIVTNQVGFSHFLWSDIQLLQDMGYELYFAANYDVLTSTYDADDVAKLENMGVRCFHLSISTKNPFAKENLRAYREIKTLVENNRFDLIHCHTPIVGFLTRLAAIKQRKHGTKVIYTTHGLAFTRYSSLKEWWMYYLLEKIASNFTDTIITINEEDFENAQHLCCKDVRKINGVGVDTEYYHNVDIDISEYKKKLGLPLDKMMVLSVGELSVRKNHQIIVKAIGELKNKADYIYVICGKENGNSGIADNLKKLAEERGVALHLLGHRSDIPEIMHCSDIGAIPSVREGLGLAGIQSLCAEVPLVGTEVQGIREYVIDDVTGYLCGPYDVTGYANAIARLSVDSKREELRKNCYETAQKFDKRVSEAQMYKIYHSVL